jgi:hypothetical protein
MGTFGWLDGLNHQMSGDTILGSGDIRIEGSAVGSALITGNGNIVTIVYATDVLRARPFGANPYRGLNAFDEASSHLFFGRERVVEALIGRFARIVTIRVRERVHRPKILSGVE